MRCELFSELDTSPDFTADGREFPLMRAHAGLAPWLKDGNTEPDLHIAVGRARPTLLLRWSLHMDLPDVHGAGAWGGQGQASSVMGMLQLTPTPGRRDYCRNKAESPL